MVVPDKEETLMEAFDKWRKWADDKVRVIIVLVWCMVRASHSAVFRWLRDG